jgi:DNA polymerase-3 subunit delta'
MEFKGIAGHERQKDILSILVKKGRLPHALLFSGPRGIGKRLIAFELLRNIFCEKRNACGMCHACRSLTAGTHPDLVTVAGESSIKIDELRSVRKEVHQPPFEAPLRGILIDNAELMTREAGNALLKTLEEPPPSNLFILVTGEEQAIPLTVRSRCMRLCFGPLNTTALRTYFETSCGIGDKKSALFSSIAAGSIATGLFWINEGNFELRRPIAEVVTGKKKSFTAATSVAEQITRGGRETQYLSFLLSFFRDIWWCSHSGDITGIINQDLADIIQTNNWDGSDRVQGCLARIYEAAKTMRYNVNRWLAIENLMIDLMVRA